MTSNKEKKWVYLKKLKTHVKTELKGDPTLEITQDDILNLQVQLNLSRSTLERFLDIDRTNPNIYPRQLTRDKLAVYIGFEDYNNFVKNCLNIKGNMPNGKEALSISDQATTDSNTNLTPFLPPPINAILYKATFFAFRLREIFEGRDSYLRKDISRNEQDEYQYMSTLYRFCALMGCLQLLKKNFTRFKLYKPEHFSELATAIYQLQHALTDSKQTEYLLMENLGQLWQLDLYLLDEVLKQKISSEISNTLKKNLCFHKVSKAAVLSPNLQNQLLESILDIFTKYLTPNQTISSILILSKTEAIQLLSQTQNWICFDWQSAIGNMMLKPSAIYTHQLELIGYGEFEELFLKKPSNEQKWFKRVQSLFDNLDIKKPPKYDARIRQLKNTYWAVIHLIKTLIKLEDNPQIITMPILDILKEINS